MTNPDVYLGPWGGSNCRDSPVQPGNRKCNCTIGQCVAEDNYFKDFQNVYKSLVPFDGKIAAFTAESIQVNPIYTLYKFLLLAMNKKKSYPFF